LWLDFVFLLCNTQDGANIHVAVKTCKSDDNPTRTDQLLKEAGLHYFHTLIYGHNINVNVNNKFIECTGTKNCIKFCILSCGFYTEGKGMDSCCSSAYV